jgi:predicted ABC-type ATPase
MARQDEWDVTPLVRKALLERASMNARGLTIEDMARQQDMFSNAPRNPAVDAMAEALDKKPRELRAAVKQFADDARQDVKGQGTMSFAQAPEAWKAFNDAFGTKLTDQQYHEGLRDILREEVEHGTGEAEGRNPAPAPDEARAEDRGGAGEKPEGPDLGILPHPEAVELKPGETTFEHFYDKENDRWAPERAANHDAVAENAVEGKTPPPEGQAPQAIITVGGTASGKSTLTRSILGDNHNQVNVDSDHLKLYVPEYEGLKESDPQKAAARVHDESKAMSKRVIAEAVKRGLDFVYDTSTGGGGEALFNRLKDMGYKIHVVFADVPVDEAITRAAKRAEESTDPANRDRIVPEEVIRKKHQQAAEAFGKYRSSPAVDQVSAYDTSTRPPKQFYERTAEGGEKIHDQDVMDRVEEKARGGKTKK